MENKCPKCYAHEDRCICANCSICEQYNCICTDDETIEDHLIRCDRCHTYECLCGDSDYENAERCLDCGWSIVIMGGIKMDCTCKK